MTQTERELRLRLAACYRVFAMLGWVEMIYNHITVRLPGGDGHFLINPFGLHYSEVTASNLVKIDVDGRVIGESRWPVNPAGFTVHSAIHRGIADAHCVMHTHTTAGCAVAGAQAGLSMDNFYSAQLHDRVAYHDFEGITVHADEGDRILQSAGGKPVLLLRNHGPVTIGANVAQAFSLMWLVQRACEVQLATQSMGEAIPIPTHVLEKCVANSLQFDPRFGAGQDAFDALQRLVDRVDPGYRR